MTIVHLKTQITVQFGEEDAEKNVTPLQALTYTTYKFSPASVIDGFQQLNAERSKLEAQHAAKVEPPEAT